MPLERLKTVGTVVVLNMETVGFCGREGNFFIKDECEGIETVS